MMSVMNMMSTNMSITKSGCNDCCSVALCGPGSVEFVISLSSVDSVRELLPSPSRKAAAYGVKIAV